MTIDYGTLIKTRRQSLGMTQKELAERIGCHRTTIIKAEQEAERMRFDLILAIFYELYMTIEVTEK